MQFSFAIHIIGIIFWIGGLLILTRFAQAFTEVSQPSEKIRAVLKKSWWLYVIHGVGLTVVTGTYQLIAGGVGSYMKQGWFHAKLTFVLVLCVATIMLGMQMAKIARTEVASGKVLRLVQVLTAVSLVAIVVMTKVRF